MQPGLIVSAAAVFSAISASAAVVTPEAARREAYEFRTGNPSMVRRAPEKAELLQLAYTSSTPHGDAFYIFNDPAGGFTIVSADDRLPAVLGFSDSGSFSAERIPDNMKWWLSEYDRQIDAFLADDPDVVPSRMLRASGNDRKPIEPLLHTKWNQTTPYNDLCPVDPRTGELSVTGCVATAMAQVMKFHEWPVHPVGSLDGYTFEGTTLDWANMLDDYDGAYDKTQSNAVALLMRQCGASVKMQYSSYSSGAYDNDVPVALSTYFDYNPGMKLVWRDYCSQTAWNNTVYDELAKGRPVYYSGQSDSGGHAFVCDGYLSNEYFHFNWGWGGYQDGYFRLNALNPATGGAGSYSGGYNRSQCIITGLYKNPGGEVRKQQELISTGNFVYNESNDIFMVQGGDPALIYNPMGYPESFTFGLRIVPEAEGGEVRYAQASSRQTLEPYYGMTQAKVSVPSLPDGVYRLVPAFLNVYSEWQDVLVPYGKQSYVTLTVQGGKKTYENNGPGPETVADLVATFPDFVGPLYAGDALEFRMTVINVGKGDYYDAINFGLYNDDEYGEMGLMSSHASVAAKSSSEIEFSYPAGLPAGSYSFWCFDARNNRMMDPIPVKILERDEKIDVAAVPNLNFTRIAPSFHSAQNPVGVTLTVENEADYDVRSNFSIRLLKASDLSEVEVLTPKSSVSVPANKTTTFNFEPREMALEPGGYYWQAVDNRGRNITNLQPMMVTGKPFRSGHAFYEVTDEAAKTARLAYLDTDEDCSLIEINDAPRGYNVTDIKAGAFTFVSDLNTVTVPAGVSSFSNALFYDADNLKTLYVRGEKAPAMGERVFKEANIPGITASGYAGYTNYFPGTEGWADFNYSSWEFTLDEGVTVSGLLAPEGGSFFNPYLYCSLAWLDFSVNVPAGSYPKLVYEFGGENFTDLYGDPEVRLPPLNGAKGKVTITTHDGSGADVVAADAVPADVYDVAGRLVLRAATADEIRCLPAGIYISAGRKFRVK